MAANTIPFSSAGGTSPASLIGGATPVANASPVVPTTLTNPVAGALPGAPPPVTGIHPGAIPPSTALPTSTTIPSTLPGTTPAGAIGADGYTALYGNDTGNAIANLLNKEGSDGNGLGQNLIRANQPNVDKGSANLNTALAASGISPSSSVSAIENADYMAGVQLDNLKMLTETNLTEQQMQQQLLETLLPGQQQRETDSSAWSIFNDVVTGIGDVAGLASPVPKG